MSYGRGKRGRAPPDPIGRATARADHQSRSAPAVNEFSSVSVRSEVGCLRRFGVVPSHLGQNKIDVGAVALRVLLDIETATPRASRADARGPS